MSWARIDDGLPDHPKIAGAGPLASWLFVTGLCYSARFLTDGFIPSSQVRRLADIDNPTKHAARLVEVGLWESVDGGYRIHDYAVYNPTREKALADKAAAKERMDRHRGRTLNERRTNGVADIAGNGEQTALQSSDETANEHRPVPIPYPSRTATRPTPIPSVPSEPAARDHADLVAGLT